MSSHPKAKVIDYWDGAEWNVSFKRSLSISEGNSLDELLLMLNHTSLTDEQDKILWALENFKIFSTKSLYSFITNRGVMLKESDSIWSVRVPLKIKIFLWQVRMINYRLL